ncbi:sialidase family protein [Dactylosporangium sp. AC04546]|uniref:sialidase family protein n=1 Tax=Dactylosporangium sp. AC04546 TaxID=2862460 RepID=UPI001EDD7CBB|nr:sialidase family protein [Dactylosporangium sp. AC04546]WVK84715.1 sialidase family protein [Dactylosporangium sp. AC04546]
MPDPLGTRLRAERDRLDIDQPPLAVITARAVALRRRHRLVQGGVAAAVAVVVAGGVAAVMAPSGEQAPRPPAASSDPGGVWTDENVTVNGLAHLPTDLPGKIRDVEFVDADRGFLLAADCAGLGSCTNRVYATADGGRTWAMQAVPAQLGSTDAASVPALVVTGSQVALVAGTTVAVGDPWEVSSASPAATPLPGTARLYSTGCGQPLLAVTPSGLIAPPQQPPGISVCWTSPVRAGDGSWWVGGSSGGKAALSVSRDDGRHWENHVFDVSGQARVAMLGTNVYAFLVDPASTPARLLGVASSEDGGVKWGPVHPTAGNATIGGDAVPLLDGRLLIVDGVGHWLVSEDRGASWHRLEGLHQTMRLARTRVGYVAYEMSNIYTAFSVDGSTWQKLDAQ